MKEEKAELTDGDWSLALGLIEEALGSADIYRAEEGRALQADLEKSVNRIASLIGEVEAFESGRLQKIKDKLNASLAEAVGSENVDRNRFEQELIFYLEKLDINEEKVRLKKHCDYFSETMQTEGSNGKMLSFIAQEMGREINTIGSKANDAGMQKAVVMMKDELERIKEQTLNIL